MAPLACAVITRMKRQALLNSFISWWGWGALTPSPGDGGEWKTEGRRKARGREEEAVSPSPISSRPGEAPAQRWGKGSLSAGSAGGRHVCSTWRGPRVIDGARCRGLLTQSQCSPGVTRSCRPAAVLADFCTEPGEPALARASQVLRCGGRGERPGRGQRSSVRSEATRNVLERGAWDTRTPNASQV